MTESTRRAQQNEAAACGGRAPGEPEELGAGPDCTLWPPSRLLARAWPVRQPRFHSRAGPPGSSPDLLARRRAQPRPDFRGSGPPPGPLRRPNLPSIRAPQAATATGGGLLRPAPGRGWLEHACPSEGLWRIIMLRAAPSAGLARFVASTRRPQLQRACGTCAVTVPWKDYSSTSSGTSESSGSVRYSSSSGTLGESRGLTGGSSLVTVAPACYLRQTHRRTDLDLAGSG